MRSVSVDTGEQTLLSAPSQKEYFETCFDKAECGCWLWKKRVETTGYAQFFSKLAHRVSYRFYKGEIPDGMLVMHSCDVRHCVNPAHLSLGTPQDNMDDMMGKGRHRVVPHGKGTAHFASKFTDEDVAAFFLMHQQGVSIRQIAKHFGAHHSTISRYVAAARQPQCDQPNNRTPIHIS